MRSFIAGIRRRLHDVGVIREVLERAEGLARSEGRDRPGAEHLVLAACDLPDGTAARALAAVGTTPDALAAAIRAVHAEALEAVRLHVDEQGLDAALPDGRAPRGAYHSEVPLQEVFGRARELVAEERSHLSGAWLLVAAAERHRGTLAQALRRLDVDRAELVAAGRAAAARYDVEA